MVRIREIQDRRSSSSLSTSSMLSASRSSGVEKKNVITNYVNEKILISCSCDYSCCSYFESISTSSSLCSFIVNSIFCYFSNKREMKKRRKTLIEVQEQRQRRRRRERKPLLLESDIIGNYYFDNSNIGNKNPSSMIINTTSKTTISNTTSSSSTTIEVEQSNVDFQQSITYPPSRYFFNNRYQITGFDFERFR